MTKQAAFVNEFLKIREELIRPTLEKIGEQLKAQGHDYELTDDPMPPIAPLLSSPYASLTLVVFPGDLDWKKLAMLPLLKVPYISFGISLAELKMEVFVKTSCENRFNPGSIRTMSHHDLKEITEESIKVEVNKFLNEIPLELVRIKGSV